MELNKVAHFKDVFFTFWNFSFRMLDISGFSIHLLGYHSSLATNGSLKYRDTNTCTDVVDHDNLDRGCNNIRMAQSKLIVTKLQKNLYS